MQQKTSLHTTKRQLNKKKVKRKILFIYPNQTGQVTEQLGICYLSSILQNAGHQVALFDTTYLIYKPFEEITRALFDKIDDFKPDVIGFSCSPIVFDFAKRIAEAVKEKYSTKIIFGGVYPTINPETVLKCEAIDYICVGEGEDAFLEFVENLDKEKPINNIWTRKRKTPLNPLIQDLDRIPLPDRDIFDIPPEKKNIIITARGCPYSCTYCFNCFLNEKYKGQKTVRFRGVENVMQEVKELVKKYKIDYIYFCDDVFTFNKERLIKFCEAYKEIKLPFACNARAEQIDRESAIALKEAGCIEARIGIESGNEELRRKVLNRYVSNEKIIEAFRICREVGLRTYAFNMIGLPFETKKTIRETFEINKKVKADGFQVSILYPFEGSVIYDIYKNNGYFPKKKNIRSYMETSIATFPNITEKELLNYHRFSKFYLKVPTRLFFLVDMMRILPLKKLNIFRNEGLARMYSKLRRRKVGSFQADVFKK